MAEAEQQIFLRVGEEENEEEPLYTDLHQDFLGFNLGQYMQYSNTLYQILHEFDRLQHRMNEFLTAFNFTPRDKNIYIANYERRPNWAYYLTRDILSLTNRADLTSMNLNRFVTLLVQVPESKIIRFRIHQSQDAILGEFNREDLVKIPAVLVYNNKFIKKETVDIFKQQLSANHFRVNDIYKIEDPSKQDIELREADAVFVIFDEEMNRIFDETLGYTAENGQPDFRHIGRILYHNYLVNDCRNERIYLFLTPKMNAVLHESFKYPWMLKENNLNFANDQDAVRPFGNRMRTYIKPPVLPDDVGYINHFDNEARLNIDTLLGRLYQNHNRPNRNYR